MLKLVRRQKIWLALVLVVNLTLWVIPSDIVEQIARDRQTLLGRYSREHFTAIIVVILVSLVSLYVDWSTGPMYKRRRFQVMAILLIGFPVLVLADFLMRSPEKAHYVQDEFSFHRPPYSEFHATFEDKPNAHRSYPNAPPGHGIIRGVLRTDKRGYRNQVDLDEYDVVVLGDSFAEGSNVSDEDVWPVRLAEESGVSVYNLGMSSYDPMHYLESLNRYGLALNPKYVVCMVYEGNDFRSAKSDRKRKGPSLSKRLRRYFKQSPIVMATDRLLIETFGPINCRGAVSGVDILDWLPLRIPEGDGAKHYAFEPKQLRDLYQSSRVFAVDRHWLNPRAQLAEMNTLCEQSGARLIVVFAPTKAHVTLPLVADQLDPEKVRAFTAISYKGDLPEAAAFLANLLSWIDARETVVGDWCRRESIAFVSLTPALSKATRAGTQTYFTYDQHWTPEGHRVVAEAIGRSLATYIHAGQEDASSQ